MELIDRQQAIDTMEGLPKYFDKTDTLCLDYADVLAVLSEHLPSVEPDEKLEKCRFEYINACRIVTFPTPDTTKKDISDAYAVIKVLQPIFGDVVF